MTAKEKKVQKVLTGDTANIKFAEFTKALIALGFINDRTTGSHQIWIHVERNISLNIQPGKGNMAKPYQIKQFRDQWK